ncbi:alanine--tRNA ligase, partial [bacterium]|nr:alanine--tRNA ligase [bacterium]
NFSFGDYFKKEAIEYAWEFITKVLKLDKDKLWVSVFKDDDETYDIWAKHIGFPKKRIVRLGEKDNFWGPAGPTGACGPSSEIYYDLGKEKSCGKHDCAVGCDCERYLEFWNIVFPQYDQQEDGSRLALPRRGIDTGMGLERLSFIMQFAENNYCSDLFKPIIDEISKLSSVQYSAAGLKHGPVNPFHVIADHIRALTFTLAENIMPSNDGRGYVLRRILRRAYRFGSKLGFDEPFLYKLVGVVTDVMKEAYPELVKMQEHTANIIKIEEQNFKITLSGCSVMLDEVIEKSKHKKMISGQDIFKLYDTYGVPIDMLEDIADENNYKLDLEGFNRFMEEQKQRARSDRKTGSSSVMFEVQNQILAKHKDLKNDPYGPFEVETEVLKILSAGGDALKETDNEAFIIVRNNPCYGESGGQIGDSGFVFGKGFEGEILDSVKFIPEITTLKIKLKKGIIKKGDKITIRRDEKRRRLISANHTATHLLHHVLREEFGDSVKQAGSYVGSDRLRFDFTYFESIPKEKLDLVERKVNEKIFENHLVSIEHKAIKDALDEGVIALFGEKYGEQVRVVFAGDFSKELCGGIHVERTGDIGLFRIISETSVAAGVRRIEALTGIHALEAFKQKEHIIEGLLDTLKVHESKLYERVVSLQNEVKEKDKILKGIKAKDSAGKLDDIIAQAKDFKDGKFIARKIDLDDVDLIKA